MQLSRVRGPAGFFAKPAEPRREKCCVQQSALWWVGTAWRCYRPAGTSWRSRGIRCCEFRQHTQFPEQGPSRSPKQLQWLVSSCCSCFVDAPRKHMRCFRVGDFEFPASDGTFGLVPACFYFGPLITHLLFSTGLKSSQWAGVVLIFIATVRGGV